MSDVYEDYILGLIQDYLDCMYRHFIDCIGDEDYIISKIRFYGETKEKIEEYRKYLESL